VGSRCQDFQLHDLVARRHGRQAAATQAQLAAAFRQRRNLEFDRPAEGRGADRGAQCRLPGRYRQHADDVATVNLELRMRGIFDFQQEIATAPALPRQMDHLARLYAFGDAYIQGLLPTLMHALLPA
jgi:hypothetical protein